MGCECHLCGPRSRTATNSAALTFSSRRAAATRSSRETQPSIGIPSQQICALCAEYFPDSGCAREGFLFALRSRNWTCRRKLELMKTAGNFSSHVPSLKLQYIIDRAHGRVFGERMVGENSSKKSKVRQKGRRGRLLQEDGAPFDKVHKVRTLCAF